MHKKLVIVAVVLFVALPALAQTNVRCESADGRYAECDMGGIGRVTLSRQLSDANCVEGKTWGYRDGKVWVNNGCRADFALMSGGLDRLVMCESINGKPAHCDADTTGGVKLARQVSDSNCRFGKEWGYDRNGIWVTDGCRAEFAVRGSTPAQVTIITTTPAPAPVSYPRQTAYVPDVTCSSENNTRQHCRADTSAGITLVRQLSDNPCILGSTWGVDRDGVWVTNGCRGEFSRTNNPASSQTAYVPTIKCSSENNAREHCSADTRTGITLVRQLSDNPCIRDRTWGVDRNGIWVTEGCRGEFTYGHDAPAVAMTSAAPAPLTLVCESTDGRRNHCAADTSFGVRMLRQMSDANCVLNSTWGYDSNGIWVTKGCRAEFAVGEGYGVSDHSGPQAAHLTCESKDGKRTVCTADTRLGVAVVRQISDKPCILNSTWGYNTDGIWVTAGCRAEFVLRK